jgi:helicase
VQLTVELDEVHLPINKKSTQKEPQLWPNELRRQGVSARIMSAFQRFVADSHQPTLRAKKAVACLMFISGRAMTEIEQILAQFGGGFGGVAGAVRGVGSRTCDILPTAARVAEILHPTLDLGDRVARLTVRLTMGIPGAAVDLAREAGSTLLRADYCRLAQAGLCEPTAIAAAVDTQILACVDGDREKLTSVRETATRVEARRLKLAADLVPILEAYVA